MKASALFAPDGMRVSGGVAERFGSAGRGCALTDVVVAHEREDDGLVHHHGWAVGGRPAAPRDPGRALMDVVLPGDHDDGLVHRHDWAVSAR